MTQILLTKHHALGNDFLATFDEPDHDLGDLARKVCDRRRGIGADGLLIGIDDPHRPLVMVLYNADGSRAEISGNGLRCFAQAVAMRHHRYDPLRVNTDAGERWVQMEQSAKHVVIATASMGFVGDGPTPDGWADLGVDPIRPVAHLSLGNPHCVVGVDDVDAVDLAALGAKLPSVNLEIIAPGPQHGSITMRVHERGVGLTEACGSGACAAAAAARRWGLVPASVEQIVVHMPGGDATVRLTDDGEALLTGPAEYLATIIFEL